MRAYLALMLEQTNRSSEDFAELFVRAPCPDCGQPLIRQDAKLVPVPAHSLTAGSI